MSSDLFVIPALVVVVLGCATWHIKSVATRRQNPTVREHA
jgi:hypothetical protein